MEIFWTGMGSLLKKDFKLKANTSIWMFLIYGMVVFMEPVFMWLLPLPLILRGVAYTLCIFAAEYIAGSSMKLADICPWDYSGARFAVHGVIRLDYAPAWFVASLIFERIYLILI